MKHRSLDHHPYISLPSALNHDIIDVVQTVGYEKDEGERSTSLDLIIAETTVYGLLQIALIHF